MRLIPHQVRARAEVRELHGHRRITIQRLISLSLLTFGVVRTVFWLAMMAAQLLGVPVVVELSKDVTAVFFISLYANFATDFDQVTSSFAALFASDSHHDAEVTRHAVAIDAAAIERDLQQLAGMIHAPEADALIARLREQIIEAGAASAA